MIDFNLSSEMNVQSDMIKALVEAATKVFIKISQNSQKSTCATCTFFLQSCNLWARKFIKNETQVQVFFREFCVIFETRISVKHLGQIKSDQNKH